jgi:hypothetical protein
MEHELEDLIKARHDADMMAISALERDDHVEASRWLAVGISLREAIDMCSTGEIGMSY